MSKIVRRLAAVAAIVVVLGVPGFSFAAVPVEQDRGDSPAGIAGVGEVWWGFWAWVGSILGQEGSSGGTGSGNAGTTESNAGGENPPPGGGNGDVGGGSDPGG
jgi:hypothetical protein